MPVTEFIESREEEEVFFYYDSSGRAYYGLHFYYACRPLAFDRRSDETVDDESPGSRAGWRSHPERRGFPTSWRHDPVVL